MTSNPVDEGSIRRAVDAIRAAIVDGADRTTARRTVLPVAAGELLLMPAESRRAVGTKVISVAHHNAERGLPRIQGTYLLMDAATLTPVWQTDAAALTVLRTTAVTMAGVETLLAHTSRTSVARALVWGTGPQAERHVAALAELGLADTCTIAGRSPASVERVVSAARASCADMAVAAARNGDVAGADLIVCCTSATSPLFDDGVGAALRDDVIVAAIGSHRPDERELPTGLMGRASIVVDGTSAIDTAGDVRIAVADLGRSLTVVTLGDVLRGATLPAVTGPYVFKTVGEAWQDLAVAESLAGDRL